MSFYDYKKMAARLVFYKKDGKFSLCVNKSGFCGDIFFSMPLFEDLSLVTEEAILALDDKKYRTCLSVIIDQELFEIKTRGSLIQVNKQLLPLMHHAIFFTRENKMFKKAVDQLKEMGCVFATSLEQPYTCQSWTVNQYNRKCKTRRATIGKKMMK